MVPPYFAAAPFPATSSMTIIASIPFPQLDPVALHLGPLQVRWYGLAYLVAFALGYLSLRRMSRTGLLRLPPDALGDLVAWLVAGVMLGGRLGWWLFYHRAQGAAEPWYEPLALWHGGMSFHGGLLGVLIALLIWSWKRRMPFWNLADCLALVAPIGLFLGRVANFINAELVGRPTSLPWGVIFPGEAIPRHPSQLYEALLEGPALLLVLWIAFRFRRPADGRIAAMFLAFYGAFRFVVEFTRQPDPQLGFIAFGWLTMGQLLSAVLAIAGIVLWLILRPGSMGSSNSSVVNPST
jgi:phosphatidylglycerol:prolipoprotein diacylglycerol transferase